MSVMSGVASFIPSPEQSVWHIGPFPLRAYALCIIAGCLVAIWIAEKRYVARGGRAGAMADMAVWAIPFGIVGGRIYHVMTDPELYFGTGRHVIDVVKVWEGGLGIWGAVAFGGVGAWIACRRYDIDFLKMADSLAPALLVAQAIGRFGNYFNQELFGRPTTVPWGLEIDPVHRPTGYEQFATFHPTFLYEALWNLAAAALLIWIDRRFKIEHGRLFALYAMLYTLGRGWIEMLRIDTVNHIGPFRLNVWTSIIVFAGGLAYFIWAGRREWPDPDPATLAASDDEATEQTP